MQQTWHQTLNVKKFSESERRIMAQSTAWKQLEKKVATYFKETYGNSISKNGHEIIKRNLRGNDFGIKDSDVDVLNATHLRPFHFVIDCKYRTTQSTWLVDEFKKRFDVFKKTVLKNIKVLNDRPSLGETSYNPLFQMTVFLPKYTGPMNTDIEEGREAYYCIRMEDFGLWWGYIERMPTPHHHSLALHNEMVYSRVDQQYLSKIIYKIEGDYFPLKEPLCRNYNGYTPRMVPVVAQRLPKSSLIVLLIPVKAIEKHHRHG